MTDTPPVADIYQRPADDAEIAVPIRATEVGAIPQMAPYRIGACFTLRPVGTEPHKLLGANPRREAVIVQWRAGGGGTGARLSFSAEGARRVDTSYDLTAVGIINIPFRMLTQDEVWVAKTAVGTGDEAISVITEEWAR